ncbi:MAG: HAD family hydrolase [Lentisphaeria bacterium]|nr:HAD family hydrolase [Lentisphaeria bacterium]
MAPLPCAFLDRDGTLIVEKNYLADPAGVELLPGVPAGLRRLRELGYALVVVTNQSGVGRGYFRAADVEAVHGRLRELLAAEGVRLDGIYWCPHRPEEGCRCRKPAPGLIEQACRDAGWDLRRSVVIGDKACDIEQGKACGLRTILVTTGYGDAGDAAPDAVASSLDEAARWLAHQPESRAPLSETA